MTLSASAKIGVYSNDRKDDLWFNMADISWWNDNDEWLRDNNSHTATYWCKSNAGIAAPINRRTLRSIEIYTSSGKKRKTISFNTDYYLRPHSMHSYTRGSNYEFITMNGNDSAACLTLSSIEFKGANGTASFPPIRFTYSNENPNGWDMIREVLPEGPDAVKHFIEERDVWGYYCSNDGTRNDFMAGVRIPSKTNDAKAWSISEVVLSNGLKLKWEYEPNRYDASNQVRIGFPIYGGGIRVRKLTAETGTSTQINWNYIYTSDRGVFTEKMKNGISNMSGHATVEPFNYLQRDSTEEYRTAERRRGGLYTPAKILYEMVQVIRNYQEPDLDHPNGVAPEGYTIYTFLTSLNNPNRGNYGDVDNSWRRGYLREKAVYDKDDRMVSCEKHKYYFQPDIILNKGSFYHLCGALQAETEKYTMGIAREVERIDTINGVENKTTFYYMAESNGEKGIVNDTFQMVDSMFIGPGFRSAGFESGGSLVTKHLGNPDVEDLILVTNPYQLSYGAHYIQRITDIEFIDRKGSYTERTNWFESRAPVSFYQILGIGYDDVSHGPDKDLVIFGEIDTNPGTVICPIIHRDVPGSFLEPIVFRQIGIFGDQNISTAIMHDFNGNGIPDVLFYAGGGYNPTPTKLFVISDLDYRGVAPYYSDIYISDSLYVIKSRYATVVDYDGNMMPDLMCAGPDVTGCDKIKYQVTRCLIMNISLDMVSKKIRTGVQKTLSEPVFCLSNEFTIGDCYESGLAVFLGVTKYGINELLFSVIREEPTSTGKLYAFHTKDTVVYRDYDGTPDQTFVNFLKDTTLATITTPAYVINAGMGEPEASGNFHMLTQTCGQTTYKIPPTISPPINAEDNRQNVLSAIATPWYFSDGCYLPKARYQWKAVMDSSGMPSSDLTPFDFSNGASNPTWRITDSILSYSRTKLPQATAQPIHENSRIFSATVYGYNGTLPIGSVSNSLWDECGIYTCDYRTDLNPNYWDYDNGWERGDPVYVELIGNENNCHFGDSSIHVVNNIAAGRNNRIYPGKTYEMTAWTKVTDGAMLLATDFRWIPKDSARNWPSIGEYLIKDESIPSIIDTITAIESGGKWKMLKITIPYSITSNLPDTAGRAWYARAWVGRSPGDHTVEGYIDEIRMAPIRSKMSTTYYDPTFRKIILSVDENHNPGKRVTYDGLGRPVLWQRIDPTRSKGEPGYGIKVQEKSYRLSREGIIISNPRNGDDFVLSQKVNIEWENECRLDVSVLLSRPQVSPILLATIAYIAGKKDYSLDWMVQDLPENDDYSIDIVATDPKYFDNAGPFKIVRAKVIRPAKGDKFVVGTAEEIRFVITQPDSFPITINIDGGPPINTGSELNNGTYIWHIPPDYPVSEDAVLNISCNGLTVQSEPFNIRKIDFIKRFIVELLRKEE